MRPVDKAAASLISWMGGGVQPANRGLPTFCPEAPIWRFLGRLDAVEDPEQARKADHGLYLMEAFPALALPSIEPAFFGRLKGPHYNPARRKTFRRGDWRAVIAALRAEASRFDFKDLVAWFDDLRLVGMPKKADQDRLDASIRLMIAIRWRLGAREASIILGDLKKGYMVAPVSAVVRNRIMKDALTRGGL